MTQQWGGQGANQQWGQPTWNRPTQAWGAPPAGTQWQPQQPQYQQPQYPQGPYQYPTQGGGYGQYQAPQPGYQQPGNFSPQNQGPKRRSPFRSLLLGLLMLAGIALFAMTMISFLNGGSDDESAGEPADLPTVIVPTTEPDSSTSTPPPTEPTQEPGNAVEAPAPDFNPSDIPQPDTYSQATKWLTANAVYAESVANPTDCAVPELNMRTASVSQLTAHLNDLTACLWKVWSPPLTSAGFELPRPPVTVYTEPITTGCGSLDDVNAVYCAADQRIYYAKPLYKIFPADQQQARFVVETVLAHEFGHTIQARTGLLISSMAWEQKSSKAEAKVYSRRLEVQADCLSGMFSSAVATSSGLSDAELANLAKVMYNLGDDVLSGKANYDGDHGLGRSRQAWLATGLANTAVGKCNTFVAPASAVR
ncbi:MAG TPA: neutral zinc metallopeptidase [Propionicimonas sp.]|nr:neutral zinc metallopeptidase [Propionicimonas sp.]HQA77182.1 neutral zinc metallopeptidase [Propionicimonas sp.]HQD96602.1 neutral zinc metallopeptidase [Propionicimonas sp.]